MAIERILELIAHDEANGPAKALTSELRWHEVMLPARQTSAMGGKLTLADDNRLADEPALPKVEMTRFC